MHELELIPMCEFPNFAEPNHPWAHLRVPWGSFSLDPDFKKIVDEKVTLENPKFKRRVEKNYALYLARNSRASYERQAKNAIDGSRAEFSQCYIVRAQGIEAIPKSPDVEYHEWSSWGPDLPSSGNYPHLETKNASYCGNRISFIYETTDIKFIKCPTDILVGAYDVSRWDENIVTIWGYFSTAKVRDLGFATITNLPTKRAVYLDKPSPPSYSVYEVLDEEIP